MIQQIHIFTEVEIRSVHWYIPKNSYKKINQVKFEWVPKLSENHSSSLYGKSYLFIWNQIQMKSGPYITLGKVGVSSNIAQIIRLELLTPVHMKCWPKVKLIQVGISSSIAQITHLASGKSYLVIICHNSHTKLTNIEIRSSWSRFEHCSESRLVSRKSYLIIICPSSHEVPFHISPQEVISGHYLTKFTWTKTDIRKSHYLPQFGLIHAYFMAPIYHFAHILPYLSIFPTI